MSVMETLTVVSNPYEELLSQINTCIGDRIEPGDKHTLRLIISKFNVDFPSPIGPPVAVNRAFYFSHEHEDFEDYYPAYNSLHKSNSGPSFSSTVVDDGDVPQPGNESDVEPASVGLLRSYRSSAPSPPSSPPQTRKIESGPSPARIRERKKLTRKSTSGRRSSATQRRTHRLVGFAARSPSHPLVSIEHPFLERSVTTAGLQEQTPNRAISDRHTSETVCSIAALDEKPGPSHRERSKDAKVAADESTEKEKGQDHGDVNLIKRDLRSPEFQDTQDSGIADVGQLSPPTKRGREEFEADFRFERCLDKDDGRERKKSKAL